MAEIIETVCTLEELRNIVETLKLDINNLDDVEILLTSRSGGSVCSSGCRPGCQACQPGNRYGPKTEDDENEDEDEIEEAIVSNLQNS